MPNHRRHDRHRHHREVANLTCSTFRDPLILDYEIPKDEGDRDTPNLDVPLNEAVLGRKMARLLDSFPSQRTKPWLDADTCRAPARWRGIECASPTGDAPACHAPKLLLR